jgi:hypothetical protein
MDALSGTPDPGSKRGGEFAWPRQKMRSNLERR